MKKASIFLITAVALFSFKTDKEYTLRFSDVEVGTIMRQLTEIYQVVNQEPNISNGTANFLKGKVDSVYSSLAKQIQPQMTKDTTKTQQGVGGTPKKH